MATVITLLAQAQRRVAYHNMISRPALQHLRAMQGFTIVYTHFGQNCDCQQVIAAGTQEALRTLEREYRDGQIYVTTTSKLLNYYHSYQYLVWSHQHIDGEIQIHIHHLDDPVSGQLHPTVGQLQGVTFYVSDSSRVGVYLGGVKLKSIHRNPPDDSGVESVTIPFARLSFPY